MLANAAAGTRTNAPSWLAAKSGVANSAKHDGRKLPGWALGSWHLLKAPVAADFYYPVTVNRTHRRVIGWHQSLLNQASNPFHSELERQAMMLLDLMADVASFRSQSRDRISYDFDGRECKYTPDIRSILSSGRTLYLEVKPIEHYAIAENVQRTIAINRAIRAAGASFRILTDKCLSSEPRKGNIGQLQIYRSIEPDPITAHRIKFFLTRHEVSTIRELGGLSSDRVLGHETVMSLILRRSLLVDLNATLGDTTMVRLAHPTNP